MNIWERAVELHTSGKYGAAIATYRTIEDRSARVLYNMACAFLRLYDVKAANACLSEAIAKDQNLAIAFFQRGTLHYKTRRYAAALIDWERALGLLRGNSVINYNALGMMCRLHLTQIYYNLGLAMFHHTDGDVTEARHYFREALHDVNDVYWEKVKVAMNMLKAGKMSELEPLTVSPDKLFRPPRHVATGRKLGSKTSGSQVIFSSNQDVSAGFSMERTIRRMSTIRAQSNRGLYPAALKRSKSYTEIELANRRRAMGQSSNMGTVHSKQGILRSSHPTEEQNVKVEKSRFIRNSVLRKSFKRIRSFRRMMKTKSDSSFHRRRSLEQSRGSKSWSGLEAAKCSTPITENPNEACDSIESDTDVDDVPAKLMKADDKDMERASVISLTSLDADSCKSIESTSNSSKHTSQNNQSMPDVITFGIQKRGSKRSLRSSDGTNRSILPLSPKQNTQSFIRRTSLSFKRKKKPDENLNFPTLVMQGFDSVTNLATMFATTTIDNPKDEFKMEDSPLKHVSDSSSRKPNPPDVTNASCDQSTESAKKTSTLANMYGDRTTVVKYALSMALDVATAAITPLATGENKLKQKLGMYRKNKEHQTTKTAQCGIPERNKRPRSKKNKRAPEPPSIADSLKGTCNIFAAFVQHDFGSPNPSSKPGTETQAQSETHVDLNRAFQEDHSNSETPRPAAIGLKDLANESQNGSITKEYSSFLNSPRTYSAKKLTPPKQQIITTTPMANMQATNAPSNSIVPHDASKFDHQFDETCMHTPVVDYNNNAPCKMQQHTESLQLHQEKPKAVAGSKKSLKRKPPDYPPPPLRLTQEEIVNYTLGKSMQVASAATSRQHLVESAARQQRLTSKKKKYRAPEPDNNNNNNDNNNRNNNNTNSDDSKVMVNRSISQLVRALHRRGSEHDYVNAHAWFAEKSKDESDFMSFLNVTSPDGDTTYVNFQTKGDLTPVSHDYINVSNLTLPPRRPGDGCDVSSGQNCSTTASRMRMVDTREEPVEQYSRKFHIPKGLIDIK